MTIDYTLEVEDLVACTLHMQATYRPRRRVLPRLITALAWASWIALLGYAMLASSVPLFRWVALALVAALSILNHRSFRETITENCLADLYGAPENRIFLGTRTLTTSDQGFVVKGQLSESSYPWSAVYRVVQTEKHIFLYIAASLSHAIPTARCLSPAQARNLYQALTAAVPQEARPTHGA